MFRVRFRSGMFFLGAFLVVAAICTVPVHGQNNKSPVAPNRERVEAAVREAFDKFAATRMARMPTTFPTSRKWIRSCSA